MLLRCESREPPRSLVGQKLTRRRGSGMSALPMKADVDSDIALGRKLVFVLSDHLSEPKAFFGDLVSRFRISQRLPQYLANFGIGTLVKHQLLYPPIGRFGGIDQIFRRAGERMGTGEFLQLASGFADHTQHLAVERDLEDASREG